MYFPHFYTLLLPVNSGCGNWVRCFLFELYGLFRRTDEYHTLVPLFPSQVKWACAACNRRKISCLLCLSHGLALLGATAQWLRCIVHLCRSFLGFQVLPLELHIALEIYVVPFSNAKVVGSFRMARPKHVPAQSGCLKFLQPQEVVNFSEVLLFTECRTALASTLKAL